MLYFLIFYNAVSTTIVGIVLAELLSEYHLDVSQGGNFSLVQYAGSTLGILSSGYLLCHYEKWSLLIILYKAFAVGMRAILGAGSLIYFLILLLFIDVSTKLIGCNPQCYGITNIPNSERSFLNLLHGCFGIGSFLGPILSGSLLERGIRWQMIFGLIGIAAAALTLILLLYLKKGNPPDTRANQAEKNSLLPLLRQRRIRLLMLVLFFYCGHQCGISNCIPLFLSTEFSVDTVLSGLGVSAFCLGLIVSRFLCSWLTMKFHVCRIMLTGIVAAAALYLLGIIATNLPMTFVGLGAAGLFAGATIPLCITLGYEEKTNTQSATSMLLFLSISLSGIAQTVQTHHERLGGCAMGKTISEKILARAARRESVSAGEIVWANIDRAMMDDILGPRVEIAEKIKLLGNKVWDPEKVVIISDHYTPPASIQQAEIVKFTREWAHEYGVEQYFEFAGPCHQVMAETGNVLPGSIVLGTDSHTCMGGALGAFACGIGSTEMLGVLVTGKTWLRVPQTIRVKWNGSLPAGVMAKDISLKTIGTIGHAGATYKAVEYVGKTIYALSMDERMAITNMAVEMGAKVGLMPTDDVTKNYLKNLGIEEYEVYCSDPDAEFCEEYRFDAGALTPQVACPHGVDQTTEAANVQDTPIHQAYLGSCTGGRLNDIAQAAMLLRDKKICKGVRMLVSPASTAIWKQADEAGYLGVLVDAGATVLAPTCGVCVGLHSGLIASGETCISSSNRNFIGRMGSKERNIYLGSPLTVAASAVEGKIIDPRNLL